MHIPWMLTALGLTYLLSESALFMPVRVWFSRLTGPLGETLVYCSACTGFWAGVVTYGLSWLHLVPLPEPSQAAWIPVGSCFLGAAYGHWRGAHPTYELEREMIEDVPVDTSAETNAGAAE